ncbi:MAG: aminotransferase class I/II-fold pyridoxal phosphate-dependent enzyme [Vicinamibacterales bacterium]
MALSRRAFVSTVGVGAAVAGGYYFAGGRLVGPWTRDAGEGVAAANGRRMLLHNNENPLGPGDKALAAMRAKLSEPGIPLARYRFPTGDVADALAAKFSCKPENVLLGCGSTQVLRSATHAFTSATAPLVMGTPSYEECPGMAAVIGSPVKALPLTSTAHLDLDAMADAAKGAGLVFLCNPNNPTATVHGATAVQDFVDRVVKASPNTIIAIDEAYHDYVTDPNYATQVPLALANPNVIVARTFSKAYGMAGLRLGYVLGMKETLDRMREVQFGMSLSVPALAAAVATLQDPERLAAESRRNTEARQFTLDWFSRAGYTSTDSQTNFIFVNIGRPAAEFRDACAKEGILVGRDFPPFEKTHTRISIGTMAEMQEAVKVFGNILAVTNAAAA